MDMSKLPRLSQSDAPPPPHEEPAAPAEGQAEARRVGPVDYGRTTPDSLVSAGEVWVAAIVGIIFVYLGQRFGSFLLTRLKGQPFHTGFNYTGGPLDGREVPYHDLVGHAMINDAGMFLFGLAVLLDAVVIATANRPTAARKPLLGIALLATLAATAFNLYVAVVFFKDGTLPLFSLLAVAVGGYAATIQWAMLKRIGGGKARA